MNPLHSLLFNVLAIAGCTAAAPSRASDSAGSPFELAIVANEVGAGVSSRLLRGTNETVLMDSPAVLSNTDLRRARVVSRGSWSILSGGHRTSSLVLTLKRGSAERFHAAAEKARLEGRRLAVVLKGEVWGVMVPASRLEGEELSIDGSLFSPGSPDEREAEARSFARQIEVTLSP